MNTVRGKYSVTLLTTFVAHMVPHSRIVVAQLVAGVWAFILISCYSAPTAEISPANDEQANHSASLNPNEPNPPAPHTWKLERSLTVGEIAPQVALSPDGDIVAVEASFAKAVTLWDVRTGNL